jgi:hypothetical protein
LIEKIDYKLRKKNYYFYFFVALIKTNFKNILLFDIFVEVVGETPTTAKKSICNKYLAIVGVSPTIFRVRR